MAKYYDLSATNPAADSVIPRTSSGFAPSFNDHLGGSRLDLAELLLPHPHAAIIVRSDSDHLVWHIRRGDIIVIDRSLSPQLRDLVLAQVQGRLRLCQLVKYNKIYQMITADQTIVASGTRLSQVELLGVVSAHIHRRRNGPTTKVNSR